VQIAGIRPANFFPQAGQMPSGLKKKNYGIYIMSLTPLEELVKDTRHAFIIAKADGILDAGEVIQIATNLVVKIQKLGNLSGSEKKAMLLMTLKKGLDASGGLDSLPGFINTSKDTKQAFEESLMAAVSVSVDMLLLVAAGKLDLRKPSSWKACLPACMSAVKALIPKDQMLLQEAAKYSETILNKELEEPVTVIPVEPDVKVENVKKEVKSEEANIEEAKVNLPGTSA
jgi:hypothetical protein